MIDVLQKKNDRVGCLGRKISLDTVEMTGLYLDDTMNNWKLMGSISSGMGNQIEIKIVNLSNSYPFLTIWGELVKIF